jgi:hypothetical protein
MSQARVVTSILKGDGILNATENVLRNEFKGMFDYGPVYFSTLNWSMIPGIGDFSFLANIFVASKV